MRYFITGDCHGNFHKIEWFCTYNMPKEPCTMILLGDVALNYHRDYIDNERKKLLSEYPITFLAIHGNHEERPSNIFTYKQKEWHGGIVYYEEKYPTLLFAKDGEIYDLEGKKAIAIGGAYSIDKEYRLATGLNWFADEQPSPEIKKYVEAQLEKHNWKVDYVFSHTTALKYEPTDLFLDCYDQSRVDKSTEKWLSELEKKLTYEKWWFGHYHGNREYANACMLFEEIKELGSNETVQKIGIPQYKMGEMVMFYYYNSKEKKEEYGRISIIDRFGTFGQTREVSYDIESMDRILYKHIPESDVFGFQEVKGDDSDRT